MAGITITTIGDLIDVGGGYHAACGDHVRCGRPLDLDVYDLAIQFGRRQRFVAIRLPLRCSACGSNKIECVVSSDPRPVDVQAREEPCNFKHSRTAGERAALQVIFPRRLAWD